MNRVDAVKSRPSTFSDTTSRAAKSSAGRLTPPMSARSRRKVERVFLHAFQYR
jgi:hypothetical protein